MNTFIRDNARVADVIKQVVGSYDPTLIDKVVTGIWPILGRRVVTAIPEKDFPDINPDKFIMQVIKLLKEDFNMDAEPFEDVGMMGIIRKY